MSTSNPDLSSLESLAIPMNTKPQLLNKQTIIWLSVGGAIVVVASVIALYFLFNCCSPKSRRQARQPLDDRDDFLILSSDPEAGTRYAKRQIEEKQPHAYDTPLQIAVPPATYHNDAYPATPTIVEDANGHFVPTSPRKQSRYYSGLNLGKRLSRLSSIGRAF